MYQSSQSNNFWERGSSEVDIWDLARPRPKAWLSRQRGLTSIAHPRNAVPRLSINGVGLRWPWKSSKPPKDTRERKKRLMLGKEREKVAGIISVRQPRDLCTCTHFFSKAFLLVRISPNWPFYVSSSASVGRHFFSGVDWVLRRSFYWPFLFNLAFATSRLMKQADWPSPPAFVRFLGHNSRQRPSKKLYPGQSNRHLFLSSFWFCWRCQNSS